MNPANLPFDSEAMLQGLRTWVECESPTWDANAVNRMLDFAARDMAIMGATIERIAGRQGFGGVIRARFPHPKQGEPGILIAGHMDTVHPVGTIEKLKWRREGNKCYGPGIYDMKGGNYLSLEAIRQLARASFTTPLPITVLFTPDEEVGTPRRATSSKRKPRAINMCWCPSPAARTTASPPDVTPSHASIWRRRDGRAMPARHCRRDARRSARWRGRSSPSTR